MEVLRNQITAEIANFLDDSKAACGGNKSAGARSRKATSNLDKLFKQWRKDSVAAEKARKA